MSTPAPDSKLSTGGAGREGGYEHGIKRSRPHVKTGGTENRRNRHHGGHPQKGRRK
jgi:hypothetical protein